MPGIRIQHETERNCTFTLVDGSRPFKQPYPCGMCGRMHHYKTYHMVLDETGACIVSAEIVERLKRLPGNGFRVTNAVERPPDQRIIAGGVMERRTIVAHPTLKEPS